MKVQQINVVTEAQCHYIEFTIAGKKQRIEVSVEQLMCLTQQSLGQIWSYYKQVPRG